MPNMADITVKKANGSTDIVWTGVNPSSGDKVAALWKSQTVGASALQRPTLRLWAADASAGAQRSIRTALVYPILQTENGVVKVIGYCTQNSESKIYTDALDADVGEVVHQGFNLLASPLIKSCVIAGFGPT